ncbi:hypothetical protein GCM10007424_10330 [Flavobacterium suaedae]|uniref:Uncharacterized protein n=1 Tax=Flavobacterium suaedae TaxID=1767027 RepID=A0ABQ1JQT1_9FLAO|nr:hypothetical protein GCM10007424_10330 [Flavobacterium suaedae]
MHFKGKPASPLARSIVNSCADVIVVANNAASIILFIKIRLFSKIQIFSYTLSLINLLPLLLQTIQTDATNKTNMGF